MRLLIGTDNSGKIIEISEVLSGLDLDVVTPKELAIVSKPKETGTTFRENAIKKAKHFYEAAGRIPTVSEDSGIAVEALRNELGIHTRRWGKGATAPDEEWIKYFLERMRKEHNKNATFICNIAFLDTSGALHIFEGKCKGTITDELEADYLPGLPISACFRPDGFDKVFAALTIEQKNSTSHRGRASRKLRNHLEKIVHRQLL